MSNNTNLHYAAVIVLAMELAKVLSVSAKMAGLALFVSIRHAQTIAMEEVNVLIMNVIVLHDIMERSVSIVSVLFVISLFNIIFLVGHCSNQCSGRGLCNFRNGMCICNAKWGGNDCSRRIKASTVSTEL